MRDDGGARERREANDGRAAHRPAHVAREALAPLDDVREALPLRIVRRGGPRLVLLVTASGGELALGEEPLRDGLDGEVAHRRDAQLAGRDDGDHVRTLDLAGDRDRRLFTQREGERVRDDLVLAPTLAHDRGRQRVDRRLAIGELQDRRLATGELEDRLAIEPACLPALTDLAVA